MTVARPALDVELALNSRLGAVHFVNEGMRVVAPARVDGEARALRCVVTKAAGKHALVQCTEFDFVYWYWIGDLRLDKCATQ